MAAPMGDIVTGNYIFGQMTLILIICDIMPQRVSEPSLHRHYPGDYPSKPGQMALCRRLPSPGATATEMTRFGLPDEHRQTTPIAQHRPRQTGPLH
ncbi:hypothetical protein CF98_21785 [Halopseudomonas bauzanensis]|nr:hypothetical protein CF98_21785 [Halopseudomonas bauzanensis]